jgi:hypothetical protein
LRYVQSEAQMDLRAWAKINALRLRDSTRF